MLADPGDHPFCVIEAGNNFLAGCGLLGEVACDGSRAAGVFWSNALGWPLVWDHDEETAIQSPSGGTKVSWGGEQVAPTRRRSRERFEVVSSDVATDVQRLVALGATALGRQNGCVDLADPDGNEFSVSPS